MAYSTQDDVQMAAGGEKKLLELSDIETEGEINAEVVAQAVADADAEIDSYARQRFSVPFNPVPAIVRQKSAEEAAFLLKQRRQGSFIDDRDLAARQTRLDWLRDLSRGLVTPGLAASPTKSEAVSASLVEPSSEASRGTRRALRGFV